MAGDPIISEFLASNQASIVDEENQTSDWIEIRNVGDEAIDLRGWHLTDDARDLAKWQFPDTLLPANGHLVVFASGNDRIGSGPSGEHHTNFRLSRDGEFLALVEPDGTTIASSFAPQFPIQFEDVSYGLSADQTSWGYFRKLTPGSLNSSTLLSDPTRDIVITEIMYHPASQLAEDEYIEIFNAGLQPIELDGWRLEGGVDYVFTNVALEPQEYLVIAANTERFSESHPDVELVAGGWSGQLSNSGERIRLVDELGELIDSVRYSDEGDWSVRQRGPLDQGARGWIWSDQHDGGGSSLELAALSLSNDLGQNWRASSVSGGTPGATNSITISNSPPVILETIHSPIIPQSNDEVLVTARVVDELSTGISAQVMWRVDGAADFSTVSMRDDGKAGDIESGDGIFTATLPAHSHGTVVEFYIDAVDSDGAARQWPALTAEAGQVTNLLYQVDDTYDPQAAWVPGSPVQYRQIMTSAERTEFAAMNRLSDAQMNATFITVTGTGVDVRYNAGVRFRGSGTRKGTPPNNRINLPHDRPWRGVTELNINWNVASEQVAGSALFRLVGLPAAEAKAVRMLSNGIDLFNGRYYAHVEPLGGEFANNHFPTDNNGNLYKGRRPNESPPGGKGAGLGYHGTDFTPYTSYTKLTNASVGDYTDLIDLTARLNLTSDEDYVAEVSKVVDVDQWMRFFAMNALIDNSEGGLVNGDPWGDDYAMYRGTDDPRFQMIPHDLDSLFGEVRRDFYRARGNATLRRFFDQPEFRQKYHEQLRDLAKILRSDLTETTLNEALRHVVRQSTIDFIRTFLISRSDYVLSQLSDARPTVAVTTGLPIVGEFPRTTSPTPLIVGTATGGAQSVFVNGIKANSLSPGGSWSLSGPFPAPSESRLTLNPGINRLLVQSFDDPNGSGSELARRTIDIWYDDGDSRIVSGELTDPDVRWSADEGPYHISGDLTVPEGTTLVIEPGTSVYFDPGTALNVRGILKARGTLHERIRFTSIPNAPLVPDRPNGVTGLPDGPPRWNGIHFQGSTADENVIAHTDIEYAQNRRGSIGLQQSALVIDSVTFSGTHLPMVYADRSAYVIRDSVFPDMFAEDEEPQALGLDNHSEHIKSVGIPASRGPMIIQGNVFGTNKGHNDVIDAVSGRHPGPILQILDNRFAGAQDELLDLGGDVYVAGNHFANVFKAAQTSDRGYANAISTGDAGANATVVAARNVFWDVDHAINLKRDDATIFENNTVVQIHSDFNDGAGHPNVGSAINLFVDEPGAVPGAGAYAADNIFWSLPRVFGNVDLPTGRSSTLEFHNNLIDPALVGQNVADRDESGAARDLGMGNRFSSPGFNSVAAGDFSLRDDSPARGAGSLGQDLGALIRSGVWITGEPTTVTGRRDAQLTVGGPGIFAYMYRVNEGPWSDVVTIGGGFDRAQETVRTSVIDLQNLADGTYTVEVRGRDFAGVWQDVATVSKTWQVRSSETRLVLNEILAKNFVAYEHSGSYPDLIELHNPGGVDIDLTGYSISDALNDPRKFVFGRESIASGDYLVLFADDLSDKPGVHLGFALRQSGEGVYLFDPQGMLVDSIEFGPQVRDFSIGRVGSDEDWRLTVPTFGNANVSQPLGDRTAVRINEWLASGEQIFADDFLELFNPEQLPVDLSGLFLTDEPAGDARQHQIAPLSFIAADGFLELTADGDEEAGPDHLSFRLSADEEVLALLDGDGTLLDRVLYFPQTTDVSQGRLPDGRSGYAFFPLPTPGRVNSKLQTNVSGVVISELHYHPRAESDSLLTEEDLEFIELKNQLAGVVDISGWRLHEAIDYQFAAGTEVAPGAAIVVVRFDPTNELSKAQWFREHYGMPLRTKLVGPYTGQLSNRADVVELSKPLAVNGAKLSDYESIDFARYQDGAPWPEKADGTGDSLQRIDSQVAGSQPTNWFAAPPTPGDTMSSLLGDVNGDQELNVLDIDVLHAAIRAARVDAVFDIDKNGLVNSADVGFLVEGVLNTHFGDANLDGEVGFSDFLLLANNFGVIDASWASGDFDGDGAVRFADFLLLSTNYGKQP